MEKPVKTKKGLKLSAIDRKTLLAHTELIVNEAAIKSSPEVTLKSGIHKL